MLAGSELSVSRGHMVGLAFQEPSFTFAQNAEEAARQIDALGGFSVISHPYSKVSWSWGESVLYQGIEIINSDSMLKMNFFSLVPYLPALMIKPEYTLLKMVDFPQKNLETEWLVTQPN